MGKYSNGGLKARMALIRKALLRGLWNNHGLEEKDFVEGKQISNMTVSELQKLGARLKEVGHTAKGYGK